MAGEAKSGGCLCGAVRFTATVKGAHMDACHCGMCRKWAAGPMLCIEVDDIAFEPTDALGVWASSDWAERLFCKTCGTGIGYRLRDGGFTTFAAFLFDEPVEMPLGVEVFVDSKPDTYAFAGDTKKMTGAEVIAAFGGE